MESNNKKKIIIIGIALALVIIIAVVMNVKKNGKKAVEDSEYKYFKERDFHGEASEPKNLSEKEKELAPEETIDIPITQPEDLEEGMEAFKVEENEMTSMNITDIENLIDSQITSMNITDIENLIEN